MRLATLVTVNQVPPFKFDLHYRPRFPFEFANYPTHSLPSYFNYRYYRWAGYYGWSLGWLPYGMVF